MAFSANLDSSISSLSGGEQQKLAIARTILADSQIIFADEPTDIELASRTDRSLILKEGKIFQDLQNPSAEVLYQALESIPTE
ncbi:putative ABC transport system ATP-binding protein [Streptococcus saliviloxodontae]|uniref:ABC transport system ATP-binding protein n=1 Tax=Streptococcus saliviloxodontae TaxID=1349416 RepID=A0ABS2PKD9_9STRE|nr:ATP-binding cassette domain-containing protein [Streptococcus saliviloxodontae]MBM7635898.1 putative ABC transport system ATP-binding protein [Streptococcus saliviloxodontae]